MATNHYFSNYGAKYSDQKIVEDLIVESIKIMGFDAFYLPNDNDQARDLLYGEDPVKKFQSAFPLEMYLSNANDYMGDRDFFSKFGLHIKNNVNVIISKRSFSQRVPQNTFTRPREGDLIFIPFLNGTGELYEIKFTNQTKDMTMLGRKVPFFYELELEKYRYSQEVIDTGVMDIDEIVNNAAYTLDLTMRIYGGSGTYEEKELVFQSPDGTLANATTTATVSSWNVLTGILSVTNIAGQFVDNQNVYGNTNGAIYHLTEFDPLDVNIKHEKYDNKLIDTDASSIIDFSESNPFGNI